MAVAPGADVGSKGQEAAAAEAVVEARPARTDALEERVAVRKHRREEYPGAHRQEQRRLG